MQSSLHKLGSSRPCRLPVDPGRRWFATAQPDHQTLIGAARDGLNQLRPRLRRRYIRWCGKTWRLFYAAIEEGWQTGLPDFVRAEFAGYLDCSVMQRGFAHLACEDCGLPRLVAFTCAGRGFCPTCLGRRMNQTTHNLLAHVLPAAPLRQRVLSLPYALRAPLAYEPGLMGVVARVFADSLLRWYGRRLAPNNGTSQGGLLTVIQRSSGDMRLNPHLRRNNTRPFTVECWRPQLAGVR
jgi:hypothetical protein